MSTKQSQFSPKRHRPEYLGSGGRTKFVGEGYRNWKCKKGFDDHVGDVNSEHNHAQRKCLNLMSERRSIETIMVRQSVNEGMDYRVQLGASVHVSRFLAKQGLAFRGHDESESSHRKGNFLNLLRYTGDRNPQIDKVILENAPKNRKLTCSDTQKEIVNCAAEETILEILAELGNELFSVLIDESRDVSVKEQMAIVIRFVNKKGSVVERFLGIVHVPDTRAVSLKEALQGLFVKNGLTLSRLRGQGYDGASNMSREFNDLKTLIMKENGSAYYVHCWAHQLQLTLVHVAKHHHKIGLFFQIISQVVNVASASCKRRDQLREKQRIEILESISNLEIKTGSGLNQEMGLARPSNTRWSSHFKTLNGVITLFSATIGVLEEIENDALILEQRVEATALQRKEQDMVNAMRLVKFAKVRLQGMRDGGWESLFKEVCVFCVKHDIDIPNMEDKYAGKPKRQTTNTTNLHYYRVELFYTVIDMQLQELNDRFTENSTELLICMSCLDPSNSFSSFNKDRLVQLARLYPSDFNQYELAVLDGQLENYRMDLRSDDDFKELKGIVELSQKMVEKRRHNVYPLVYKLVKLALILPVATASVERVFSAMNYVKNRVRNSMGDQFLNDCLVTYVESELFDEVVDERIMQRWQNMSNRRGKLPPLT
ncbi:uncharacterized protein LOC144562989 [Carex rostrata]